MRGDVDDLPGLGNANHLLLWLLKRLSCPNVFDACDDLESHNHAPVRLMKILNLAMKRIFPVGNCFFMFTVIA